MCYEAILDLTTCLQRFVRPHCVPVPHVCDSTCLPHLCGRNHTKTPPSKGDECKNDADDQGDSLERNLGRMLLNPIVSCFIWLDCRPSERCHAWIRPMHRGPTNPMTRSNSSCDLQIFAAMSPAVLPRSICRGMSQTISRAFFCWWRNRPFAASSAPQTQ